MFSAASFSKASFSTTSWLFDLAASPSVGMVRRMRLGRDLIDAQRLRELDDDDILLAMCGALCAAYGTIQ